MQFDPRVQALINGLAPHEKLQTLLAVANADPVHLSEVLAHIAPPVADFDQQVGGLPLFQWLGKSEPQIRLECGDDKERAEAVLSALDYHKVQVAQRTTAMSRADFADDRAERRVIGASAAPGSANRSLRIGLTGSATEPTFGDDQFPVSELWGMSDEELLDIPGVSEASIAQIRQAQRDYQARQAEADRLRGFTQETIHLGGGTGVGSNAAGGSAPAAPAAATAPAGGTALPPSATP